MKGIGAMQLGVPRDRAGKLQSVVLPPREQVDPRRTQDLAPLHRTAPLHLLGISARALEGMAREVLGMEVSRETILHG